MSFMQGPDPTTRKQLVRSCPAPTTERKRRVSQTGVALPFVKRVIDGGGAPKSYQDSGKEDVSELHHKKTLVAGLILPYL